MIPTAISAPPGCWAFDDLFVFVKSASLLEHCARKFYQQTLAHVQTFVAKRDLSVFDDTQIDVAPKTYSDAHNNKLMAAFMHRYPRHSRHGEEQVAMIPPVSARLEIAHARTHTESFLRECVVINRSKTGLGGASARSFWSCCAATPGLRSFFRCAHDSWCRQPHW